MGDVITAVDGVHAGARHVLDSVLLGEGRRRVAHGVGANGGAAREVSRCRRPLGAEKALLYRQWVEQQRAYVARISDGRSGYVHMFDMGEASLDQLYLDLDAENQAREGVVVDMRNNNGGFVNPYAIDVLARRQLPPVHAARVAPSPARGSLGQRTLERPTVLVTNQHTLSDGEDFTEGYRSLGLGKVVGEPTAGWIIFTSNVPLLDGSTLRIPSTRVTDAQGRDMELRPRAVDISVIRPVGESYSGRDRQLDAAVKALLEALPKTPLTTRRLRKPNWSPMPTTSLGASTTMHRLCCWKTGSPISARRLLDGTAALSARRRVRADEQAARVCGGAGAGQRRQPVEDVYRWAGQLLSARC